MVLSDAVNILADELERLLAEHRVIVELGQDVDLDNGVGVEVLDEMLAALDLERLDEVLFGGDVEVDGGVLDVVGQVGRVDVFEHGLDDVRAAVLDQHAVGQVLLQLVVEHGFEDGRAGRQNALVRAEFDELDFFGGFCCCCCLRLRLRLINSKA